VAQVLAPAIADWVRLGITPTSEIRARARRSSGSYRAITNAGMSVAHQSDAAIS
jgi:hypothetical protein